MHTLIVLTALFGPAAAPQPRGAQPPLWREHYSEARKLGRQQGKPLAVVFGSGARGWETLASGSRLSAQARKVLDDQYVCVYADVRSSRGRRLASAFAIRAASGLVLSTRDGQDQAFRHEGRMTARELESSLRKYANGYTGARTETLQEQRANAVSSRISSYPPLSYPGGFQGSFGGFGGFSGGGGC
jgi:hypothetical protein